MRKNKYDVIIIGAGLAGLVCGCYLTKSGKRVLILEKNNHVGGCCTSFNRGSYRFDSAAHTLGGMSPRGPIGNVLIELGILNIPLSRTNPSYILNIGNYTLHIRNNFAETIGELQKDFQGETDHLYQFWKFISTASLVSLVKLSKMPFVEFLNQYFRDIDLKRIFYALLLGNIGINPQRVSTFTAIKFYQQYILDGGYHLAGGMQTLPDLFSNRFSELGGDIKLTSEVNQIFLENDSVRGVKAGDFTYFAESIVSNIDSRNTFFKLTKNENLDQQTATLLKNLRPSSSMYVLYIGLKSAENLDLREDITYWFIADIRVEQFYYDIVDQKLTFNWIAMRLSKKSLQVFTIAPWVNNLYWQNNDLIWKETLLNKILNIKPYLANKIEFVLTANPVTISHWTANYHGATCGWESSIDQFNIPGLSQKTKFKNLFLTGHWTTTTLGIPGVVNIGRSTANYIIEASEK